MPAFAGMTWEGPRVKIDVGQYYSVVVIRSFRLFSPHRVQTVLNPRQPVPMLPLRLGKPVYLGVDPPQIAQGQIF